jgi:hypothetical protein
LTYLAEEPFLVVDQLMPQVVANHARDVSFRPWLAGTLSGEEGPAGRRPLLQRPQASTSS